jgi:hypothetical protein
MEFLSYLISGISRGSIYPIIALGYTMVLRHRQDAELCPRRRDQWWAAMFASWP